MLCKCECEEDCAIVVMILHLNVKCHIMIQLRTIKDTESIEFAEACKKKLVFSSYH